MPIAEYDFFKFQVLHRTVPYPPTMSSRSKLSIYSAVNIDLALLSELQNVAELGVFDDLSPLLTFIRKGLLLKVLLNFAHFVSVTDIPKIAQTTLRLAKVLEVVNFILHEVPADSVTSSQAKAKLELLEEKDKITEFYAEIIRNNLKSFYKIFSLRKPSAINPSLRILISLVHFKNHALFADLTDSFDFNHSSLMKLLIPTKDDFERKIIIDRSMRFHFMDFLLAVAETTSPMLRKALLTNFKIMNNFWKYIEMDKYEKLIAVINFIDKSVLSEPLLRRVTKCQILNENFLFKFSSLFAYVKPENTREGEDDDDEFERFKSSFTALMNTLVTDQDKGITFPINEFGSPITVHNKEFKINNKLIYTLLTALRPWESYNQLQYVMTILNHNTELVPPYMNWIVASSGGYHDPSLSSYWIGHTLLYSEILKSEVLPAKVDYISLPPLSSTSLAECLSYTNDLVKQLALQLILLMLNKLKKNKAGQSLIDAVLSNLPSQASYLPLLAHENDLIKFTATTIVRTYEQLAPASSSAAIVAAVKESLAKLDLDKCTKKDLVLLDNYLSIQSNNDLKWWSKLQNGRSFFTSLLKLSKIEFLRPKALAILIKLTSSTIIFNDSNLIDSPLYALIEATSLVVTSSSADKLWNCLDETISRAIKTPYKYLDKSHLEYSDLSVFFVVLLDQFKFIPDYEKDSVLLNWLSQFLTDSVLLGEPEGAMENIIKSSEIPVKLKLRYVKPKNNLTKKFDFAQELYCFNKDISNSVGDQKVFDHVSKLGNYLMSSGLSDKELFSFITDPRHWFFYEAFLSEIKSDTLTLAISLMAELFKQLETDFTKSKLNIFLYGLATKKTSPANQKLLCKFLWIFDDDQLVKISQTLDNEYLVVEALRIIADKELQVSLDLLALSNIAHPDIKSVLSRFEPSTEQLEAIIRKRELHYLLEKASGLLVAQFIHDSDIEDDLLYRIASASKETILKFQARVSKLAMSMRNRDWSIKIFTLCPEIFDQDEILRLMLLEFEGETKLGFSNDFIDAVAAIAKSGIAAVRKQLDRFTVWFHKCMLYITKKLAETLTLSSTFARFLRSVEGLLEVLEHPWRMCPAAILNAQLEVILLHEKWVQLEECTRYANKLLFCSESSGVLGDKLLQIYINNHLNPLKKLPQNTDAALRFQSALLLHRLFQYNIKKASLEAITDQILEMYLGSTRAEDLLLKDVLKLIEKKTSKSWVGKVTSWDFSENLTQSEVELVGEERLIIRDKTSMVVALKKAFVKNTIAAPIRPVDIPDLRKFSDYVNLYNNCFQGPYKHTEYDAEFLMLVILNNEELMIEQEGSVSFSLKRLIETKIFHIFVLKLSNPKLRDVSRIVLNGMCKFIQKQDNGYRDKNILLIYLSSILHTLRVADHQTPLVWYIVGSFAEIIINPSHFLYERVIRFILTTPVYKAFEIPLFHVISNGTSNDDLEEDNYYKQIAWLIEAFIEGTKNEEDLSALRLKGAVEWALNLSNAKYVTGHLRHRIYRFIYRIQSVCREGGDMLITKFAGLSSLEANKLALPKSFSGEQLALNIDQLGVRFGILSQTKRLREWASDDQIRAVKRIRTQN